MLTEAARDATTIRELLAACTLVGIPWRDLPPVNIAIDLANGWTVSLNHQTCSFGTGPDAPTAEIAIFKPDGSWFRPEDADPEVRSHVWMHRSPQQIAAMVDDIGGR